MIAKPLILLALLSAPVCALEFDANGHRLDSDPEQQREYQWTDPRTGKVVTKPYPPANLKMRQVGRSPDGRVTYLEVEGESKFEERINLKTPQAVSNASSEEVVQNCFSAVKGILKDPYSAKLDSHIPIPGIKTVVGAVRQTVTIFVNAKNSYGGYVGSQSYTCTLQMDNLSISSVDQP